MNAMQSNHLKAESALCEHLPSILWKNVNYSFCSDPLVKRKLYACAFQVLNFTYTAKNCWRMVLSSVVI